MNRAQKLQLAKWAAFVMTPETQDMLYDKFQKSYMDAVGSAWSKDKFLQRAANWNFFGPDDMSGFVATRPQQGGLEKLVGAAGSPKGVIRGIQELQKDPNRQIWGAVSEDLIRPATKHGLIAPHLLPHGPKMLKKFLPQIPSRAFGGVTPELTDRGSMIMRYPDVGDVEKFLVGSPSYFAKTVAPKFLPAVPESLIKHVTPELVGDLARAAPEVGWFQAARQTLPGILKRIRI